MKAPMSLEMHLASQQWEGPLKEFFRVLQAEGVERHFHPHPLTDAQAERIARYKGRDLYYVLVDGRSVLGYGMLRGWNAGYDVPSLGIVIHPAARHAGLGLLFMRFLHVAAKRNGVNKVRLKVYPDNTAAMKLYTGLGYSFTHQEDKQMVGTVSI